MVHFPLSWTSRFDFSFTDNKQIIIKDMSIRANKQREKIFIDAESLKRQNIYAGSNILRFETSAWNTGGFTLAISNQKLQWGIKTHHSAKVVIQPHFSDSQKMFILAVLKQARQL